MTLSVSQSARGNFLAGAVYAVFGFVAIIVAASWDEQIPHAWLMISGGGVSVLFGGEGAYSSVINRWPMVIAFFAFQASSGCLELSFVVLWAEQHRYVSVLHVAFTELRRMPIHHKEGHVTMRKRRAVFLTVQWGCCRSVLSSHSSPCPVSLSSTFQS